MESNIILITNNNGVAEDLKQKLVLLREIDSVISFEYSKAIEGIKKVHPQVVLLHCEKESECLKLIKSIKNDDEIKETSILLVLKDYNQETILNAYDENITDYVTLKASDAELLIRTLWCLKNQLLISAVNQQRELLQDTGVMDKDTGFYTKDFAGKIFEKEFAKIKHLGASAVLMLVSASEESKVTLNPQKLAFATKTSVRETDVIAQGNANRFYVLLKNSSLKGIYSVLNKIKQNIGEEYTICAGASFVENNSFDELKVKLLNALFEAISTKQDLVVVNEEEEETQSEEWIEKINAKEKNFKLFKQAFTKKLDKVITPVFFQMQRLYEDKLFETAIEQYSNSHLSAFLLKNGDNVSELKITYPGFAKINIDIVHHGFDSPENQRISFNLNDLTEEKLTQILEEFIQDFKKANK